MIHEERMVTNSPLISVITAVYNGEAYLQTLIESVLAQDYSHYEHIIVDDGSTDGTVEILKRYPHLRWWSHENKGQYATQNDAIAAAQGHLVVVIAADDRLVTPNAFRQVVDYWRQHPNSDIIYGQTQRMNQAGQPITNYNFHWSPSPWLMRYYCYVFHCSMYVSRHYLTEHNILFNPDLRYGGDWDWQIRLFDSGANIGDLKKPLSVARAHDQQTSRITSTQIQAEEYRRIRRVYGTSDLLFYVIRRLMMWRGMALVGLDKLRGKHG